jgi:hypothetical protein
MANTASLSFSIAATMDTGGKIAGSKSIATPPAGNDVLTTTQSVGTSAVALSLGTLTSTTAKVIVILASSDNGYTVQVGTDQAGTKYYTDSLDAGEFAVIHPKAGESFYLLGGGASQEVTVYAYQV